MYGLFGFEPLVLKITTYFTNLFTAQIFIVVFFTIVVFFCFLLHSDYPTLLFWQNYCSVIATVLVYKPCCVLNKLNLKISLE